MNAILLTTSDKLSMVKITEEELFNNYDFYNPKHKKYIISFAVKLWDKMESNQFIINTFATDIYKSAIFGDIYILTDDENDLINYYDELNEFINNI